MVAENKLYDALGIQASSTQDEIKKAYRYRPSALLPSPSQSVNNKD